MTNERLVHETLSSEIPDPDSMVGRNRHQVVTSEMDPIHYIGMAIFRVVWMWQPKLLVFIEIPMRAGLR